jgi:hypothetical protein
LKQVVNSIVERRHRDIMQRCTSKNAESVRCELCVCVPERARVLHPYG